MNKDELIHILRAAAAITNEKAFVVIGSQSILATHPDAPRKIRESIEGDAYPKNAPEKADLIDGSIGENTIFHKTFGYYCHGVSPETATLPDGWDKRTILLPINEDGKISAQCLEKHDLVYSKLAAGREKDFDFIRELLKHRLVNRGKIKRLIEGTVSSQLREKLERNWTISLNVFGKADARGNNLATNQASQRKLTVLHTPETFKKTQSSGQIRNQPKKPRTLG